MENVKEMENAITELRCSLSTIAGLAHSKGPNALHEIACTALAGIERLKLLIQVGGID